MRVLVTGAAGFVGGAVLRELAERHETIALDTREGGTAAGWIVGSLCEPDVLARAQEVHPDVLIHLATVPGGAAEADPALAWRVNVETAQRLVACLAHQRPGLRVIFASSIAALGRPGGPVDDSTLPHPHLLYGAHKLLMETWLGTLSRRGEVAAISLRLPGIVARPRAPSGLKSGFMSDLFHAALAGERFVSPVGADAAMWLMSVSNAARNLAHAIEAPGDEPFAFTLPALRVTMACLAEEIARQTGYDAGLVTYRPDPAIEADFGRCPELRAAAAGRLGFENDETLAALVSSALTTVRDAP